MLHLYLINDSYTNYTWKASLVESKVSDRERNSTQDTKKKYDIGLSAFSLLLCMGAVYQDNTFNQAITHNHNKMVLHHDVFVE